MTDPTLTVTIDRTSLSLDPLVLSGADDDVELGILSFQRPGLQQRLTTAPDSRWFHSSEATSTAWQQAILAFDWARDGLDVTEADVEAAYDEVAAAVGQFSFLVTTQVNGATARVWSANAGSITPSARTFEDLVNPNATPFSVSIPVYPLPGSP
jgi:hypothetical protein